MIGFGREVLADLQTALRREWLVTNGLGGYAAGTVAGINTRRYHGLLVAALTPPRGRTLLLSKLLESVHLEGDDFSYNLACNEYADGTINPHGYAYLESFVLEGMVPVWTYALAEILLEKRVWMAHGSNTTYVAYTLRRGDRPLRLELTPLCTYRDHHGEMKGGWSPALEPAERDVLVAPFPGAVFYRLLTDRGIFTLKEEWHWNFKLREEERRGFTSVEDLYSTVTFSADLEPGETLTFVATTEEDVSLDGPALLAEEMARQQALLEQSGLKQEPEWIRQLALAADQFIVVHRAGPDEGRPEAADGGQEERTVIAGYPWFGVWGRDALVAVPGLTLATGRPSDAAAILRAFARHVERGLMPKYFADESGEASYSNADAALWYFQAVGQYFEEAGDLNLIAELYPLLKQIIEAHVAGTGYDIHVAEDGLLWAGEPGLALTWMDVQLDGWAVTPRTGKPVEINALWINALRWMERFAYLIAGEEGLTGPPQPLPAGDVGTGEMLPQAMNAVMAALTPEELRILQTRADLQENPPESWEELGERLGLSAGRMLEITARAMCNLGWAKAPARLDDGQKYAAMAEEAVASFRRRFWYEQGGYLYDVVDGPEGDDSSLRPNQILAVSLPYSPLLPEQQRAVVEAVARHLLTPCGLRSLAPGERVYRGRYEGGLWERDAAYHQGTVWAWLVGPFVSAHYRVYGDVELARSYLQLFAYHLADAGLGTISEIFDGDPPFTPRGCIAQAWSVAEVLRAWREMGRAAELSAAKR
jgi:predicted glycogen debranching enzyme